MNPVWSLILIVISLIIPKSSGGEDGLVFIINRENPMNSVSRADLIDYYEKRKRQWPNGVNVRFIDREPGSMERSKFARTILNKSESDIDLFWFEQKLRTGYSMPTQISSDEMVIEMVKSFKGAIGYISSQALATNGQVKIISVSNGTGN